MAIMWGVKVPQTEVQSVRSEALYLPPSVASNRPDPPLFRRRLELGWGGGGHDLDPYRVPHPATRRRRIRTRTQTLPILGEANLLCALSRHHIRFQTTMPALGNLATDIGAAKPKPCGWYDFSVSDRHTKPPPILLGTAAVESRSLSTARGNFNARNRHQPKLGEDTPSETFSVSDCQRLVTQHITNMGLW